MLRLHHIFAVTASLLVGGTITNGQEAESKWTRTEDYYQRTVEIPVKRHVAGNVTGYALELENDQLSISEVDEDRGFSVRSHPYGEFKIEKEKENEVARYIVTLGKIRYADLNGDGLIDSMYDGRKPRNDKEFILLDGQFVEANLGRQGVQSEGARSPDGDIDYAFRNGRWVIERDRRPAEDRPSAEEGVVISPSAPVGSPSTEPKKTTLPSPTPEERDRLAAQWRHFFGLTSIDEDVFSHLSLVRPQWSNSFVKFQGEKLSPELARASLSWINRFFQEQANPYSNMVTLEPEVLLAGEEHPSEKDPFADDREWRRKLEEAREKAPRLHRHRPRGYYLAPDKGLSLLLYEFDNEDYHYHIQESSAAVLMRIRPKTALEFEKWLTRQTLMALIADVFHTADDPYQMHMRPEPFLLPDELVPDTVFWNTQNPHLPKYSRGEPEFLLPPDWTKEIAAFVTDHDVCFVVRKASVSYGAASPFRTSNWADPDPQWLRNDLYREDGKTLLVGDGARQP